jgi:hypothetical protein
VEVLELVHGLEFDYVQPIRQNTVWLALKEAFCLLRGKVRDGSKDIGAVGSRAFNAISVVDTTLPRFVIDIEVLKIIVEVD